MHSFLESANSSITGSPFLQDDKSIVPANSSLDVTQLVDGASVNIRCEASDGSST